MRWTRRPTLTIEITDEYMDEMQAKACDYTFVLLKTTPAFSRERHWPIVWEHGRRNFALRAEGLISIVCPITDDSGLAGLYIFSTSMDEAHRIMADDPGVRAGIFSYEAHPCRGFPSDELGR